MDNIVKQADIIKQLRDAIERSGLSIGVSGDYGKMVLNLPDGITFCVKCVEKNTRP